MNSATPAPLVFFRVLADHGGTPSALLADVGNGNPDHALSLLEGERFGDLGSELPCFYRSDLDPMLAQAFDAAGWKPIAAGCVFRADERLVREFLPATAVWVDGDWCMAAPAKASGAQAASRLLALQLVQLVAADADTHEIEALLRQDVTLSYHLLRLVNSLGMGAGRRVNSFSQAILILGRQQLRRWLNLMLFAAREGDLRSSMLLARVAVRGRTLELLARAYGMDKNSQEQAFMTGMFSLLGALFGMALSDVLAPLAISEAVQRALLQRQGELGALLTVVESAERAELAGAAAQLGALQLEAADFNDAVLDATCWMLHVVRGNQGRADG